MDEFLSYESSTATTGGLATVERVRAMRAREAQWILRAGFTAAPIIAGLDKFTNLLTDWDRYLAPQVSSRLRPARRRWLMRGVGVIEVAAGLLVATRPRLGGWVVVGWLGGIVANLVAGRRSWDVALRDVGLALGAAALARLSSADERVASPPTVH